MKGKIIGRVIVVLLLCISNATFGQSISKSVISSCGWLGADSSGIRQSATVGQFLSGRIAGTGYSLSQGYQHPGSVVTPILGVISFCQGTSSTLADSTSGGTWSSSNTSVATIGSSSAYLSGVTAGTSTITYSVAGNYVTTVITVTPSPAAISGPSSVCLGSGITLIDDTTGGIWSSSNTSIATIGSLSGIITSVAAGTTTITYTKSGCFVTKVLTAIPSLASISGSTSVCVGSGLTLTDTSSGGTWSSSNTSVATITSLSGNLTSVTAGTTIITYAAGGCYVTTLITVNPLPASISGTSPIGVGASTTLSDATSGGSWSTSNAGVATIGGTGNVTAISAGTTTISYTLATGCASSFAFTVISTPVLPAITGITSICMGGTTTLSNSVAGGFWYSTNGAVATVSSSGYVTSVSGGSASIVYAAYNACGIGFISALVTVTSPSPITGTTTVCSGASTTLGNSIAGGTWASSNTSVATISSGGAVNGVSAGTSTITYTALGCVVTTQVTVNPVPSAITGTSTVCSGLSTTLSNAISGGIWTSSNMGVATVGSTSGFVLGISIGSAIISYNNTCGGAGVIVTVNSAPSAGAISGSTSLCASSTTTLTDGVTGGVWSSSNTSVGTIGTSGLVTGISAGTTIISYTVSNSCGASSETTVIAVYPLPSSGTITGVSSVSVGSTTTLSSSVSGGSWTSSNIAIATVVSSGAVTGVAAGSCIISYTISNACGTSYATKVIAISVSCAYIGEVMTTLAGNGFGYLLGGYSGDGGPATAAQLNQPLGVAVDNSGNVYVADRYNSRIRKIDASGIITTIAGGGTGGLGDGGPATNAGLSNPNGVAIDNAGNIYISDGGHSRIRKVNTSGIISTVAGNGSGWYTGDGVAAIAASLFVGGIALDGAGNLYIVDQGNNRIRKVNSSGIISTIAGNGTSGYSGDGGAATDAKLYQPSSVAIDASGNIFIADMANYRVRKVNTSGIISTYAGNGTYGFAGDGGAAASATLSIPMGVLCDGRGGLYIADGYNDRVRKIDASGIISTYAGSGSGFYSGLGDGRPATNAHLFQTECLALDTMGNLYIGDGGNNRIRKVSISSYIPPIYGTSAICTGIPDTLHDSVAGGVWVSGNTSIAIIDSNTGILTGISAGYADISYVTPCGWTNSFISIMSVPDPIVGDSNVCVGVTSEFYYLSAGGTWSSSNISVATVMGFGPGFFVTGLAPGTATISLTNTCGSTTFNVIVHPLPDSGVISGSSSVCIGGTTTLSESVSGGVWSSSDPGMATIDGAGIVTGITLGTTIISYTVSNTCGTSTATDTITVDSLPTVSVAPVTPLCAGGTETLSASGATTYSWFPSTGLSATTGANVICSASSSTTYTVTGTNAYNCSNTGTVTVVIGANPSLDGIIHVVAGTGSLSYNGDGIPATAAMIYGHDIVTDASGNIYLADGENFRIRKINTSGIISTIAGNGRQGFSGDEGSATDAYIDNAKYIAIDGSGNIYFSDGNNRRIRKIDASGIIHTIAGNGDYLGYDGEGVAATSAHLDPGGLSIDGGGNIIVADQANNRIRKITPSGLIYTVAGNGTSAYSGDAGAATIASIRYPSDVAIDASGNLIIADKGNDRIRQVNSSGIISTIAGTGTSGYTGDAGSATNANIGNIANVSVDATGNTYILDVNNNVVRKINTSGVISTVAGNGTYTYSGDGVAATSTGLDSPEGLNIDGSGNIYFCYGGSSGRIGKVNTSGIISTIAGYGSYGYIGEGTVAISSPIYLPNAVAVDRSGNIYYGDAMENVIRKINSSGILTTIAGSFTGAGTYTIDGVPATSVRLTPSLLALDNVGNVWFSDMGTGTYGSSVVYKVDVSGNLWKVAGNGHSSTYTGDGSSATATGLGQVSGIVLDSSGNIYFADDINSKIFKVNTSGIITTIAGTGTAGYSGDGGAAISADINQPLSVLLDRLGNLYFNDFGTSGSIIRKINSSGIISTVAGNDTSSLVIEDGLPATNVSLTATFITVDNYGNIFTSGSHAVPNYIINTEGYIFRIEGTHYNPDSAGIEGTLAIDEPCAYDKGITTDANGNLFVCEIGNHKIIKFSPSNRIIGPDTLCPLGTGQYRAVFAGGTWSSSNPSVATIGSAGVATGIGAGTSTLTYVVTLGCTTSTVTKTIRVNSTSVAGITGSASVCIGANTTLYNTTTGGVWTSSNTSVATIGTSGTAIGLSTGTSIISYSITSACGSSYATNVLTVNPLPTLSITPVTPLCTGSSETLSASGAIMYSWYPSTGLSANTGANVVCSVTSSTTYTVLGTNTFNCSNTATVVVVMGANPSFDGIIHVLAGNGSLSYNGDGIPATVAMVNAYDIAMDASGNMFVADGANFRIRKINTSGIISTIAGNGIQGFSGDEGAATNASIDFAYSIALDGSGNIIFSDANNHRIRKIDASGIIHTIAGNGDYLGYDGEGVAATSAHLDPGGFSIDGGGNIIVADQANNRIRKITGGGLIYTVAGNGTGAYSGDGGAATNASIHVPNDVSIDGSGNLIIVDNGNYRLRKVDGSGIISTIAGTGTRGYTGDGSSAISANIGLISSVYSDLSGNTYFADDDIYKIRKINTSGTITTVAGNGSTTYAGDGIAATATGLQSPLGMMVDGSGNTYFCDASGSNLIHKVNTSGIISTIAGLGIYGYAGEGTIATTSPIGAPLTITVDRTGNVYYVDITNWVIRKISNSGILNTVAGSYTAAGAYTIDGVPATSVRVFSYSLTTDNTGNLYFTDGGISSISSVRKIDSMGNLRTVAGNGYSTTYSGDGSIATATGLSACAIVMDSSGNIYIADNVNSRIYKVNTSGIITTVAGNGSAGYSGDGGPATSAEINFPTYIALDGSGNLYFSCFGTSNSIVRKVSSSGIITTVAGDDTYTDDIVDGAAATSVSLTVNHIAVDNSGNLFTSGAHGVPNYMVNIEGYIFRIEGTHYMADSAGIEGTLAIDEPCAYYEGMAVDANENLFVCELMTHKIVKFSPSNRIVGPDTLCPSGTGQYRAVFAGGTWSSSNPSVATIGSAGVATGIGAGTSTLNYVVTLGCTTSTVTKTIRVNSTSVAGISGPAVVCTGSSISLTDTISGGVWSSSNTTVARIGTSGIVEGVSTGSSVISYTISGICGIVYSTYIIAVNPLPDAGTITGGSSVCVTSSITLSDAASGGVWSSSNTSIATVNSSGVVSGVSTGSAVISYSISGSCGAFTTKTISVFSSPASISGANSACAGSSFTLFDSTTGGTWGSSNTSVATITSGGIVSGVAQGTTVITYGFGASCIATKTVTIISVPTLTILAYPSVCQGVTSVTIPFSSTGSPTYYGVSWGSAALAQGFNNISLNGGIISTIAGSGSSGYSGDGAAATSARLDFPTGVVTDNYGNIYVADYSNAVVRKINTSGIISTFAGNNISGYSGDGGAATNAKINPRGLAFDGVGNLYIAEPGNNRVRKVSTSGIITTVAGNGTMGYSGDGAEATNGSMRNPNALVFDASGNLYIADGYNYAIRKVDGSGIIITISYI